MEAYHGFKMLSVGMYYTGLIKWLAILFLSVYDNLPPNPSLITRVKAIGSWMLPAQP